MSKHTCAGIFMDKIDMSDPEFAQYNIGNLMPYNEAQITASLDEDEDKNFPDFTDEEVKDFILKTKCTIDFTHSNVCYGVEKSWPKLMFDKDNLEDLSERQKKIMYEKMEEKAVHLYEKYVDEDNIKKRCTNRTNRGCAKFFELHYRKHEFNYVKSFAAAADADNDMNEVVNDDIASLPSEHQQDADDDMIEDVNVEIDADDDMHEIAPLRSSLSESHYDAELSQNSAVTVINTGTKVDANENYENENYENESDGNESDGNESEGSSIVIEESEDPIPSCNGVETASHDFNEEMSESPQQSNSEDDEEDDVSVSSQKRPDYRVNLGLRVQTPMVGSQHVPLSQEVPQMMASQEVSSGDFFSEEMNYVQTSTQQTPRRSLRRYEH